MRAIMSLPVPLSPWMSTGTLAPASLVKRSRTACMASVRPKTIESGGISPKGWTSELTLLVVIGFFLKLRASRSGLQGENHEPAPGKPIRAGLPGRLANLPYVADGDPLTKEQRGARL